MDEGTVIGADENSDEVDARLLSIFVLRDEMEGEAGMDGPNFS